MIGSSIFMFVFVMWVLLIVGGGIFVLVLGPLSFSGYGDFDWILSSGGKALASIGLVIVWIIILSKIKNWIFGKQIKH